MLVFLFIFLSFFQVGFFGLGGDAGAQAVLEHEVLTLHHWLTPDQMADLMTFCHALPGGAALNSATLCGQLHAPEQGHFWMATSLSGTGVLALCLAACVWTWLINRFMEHAPSQTVVQCVLVLLRPLIPGLIASAALLLLTEQNFGSPITSAWHFWVSVFLTVSTILGVTVYKFNATFMVVLCGVAGMFLL